jgi:hypothetical protein
LLYDNAEIAEHVLKEEAAESDTGGEEDGTSHEQEAALPSDPAAELFDEEDDMSPVLESNQEEGVGTRRPQKRKAKQVDSDDDADREGKSKGRSGKRKRSPKRRRTQHFEEADASSAAAPGDADERSSDASDQPSELNESDSSEDGDKEPPLLADKAQDFDSEPQWRPRAGDECHVKPDAPQRLKKYVGLTGRVAYVNEIDQAMINFHDGHELVPAFTKYIILSATKPRQPSPKLSKPARRREKTQKKEAAMERRRKKVQKKKHKRSRSRCEPANEPSQPSQLSNPGGDKREAPSPAKVKPPPAPTREPGGASPSHPPALPSSANARKRKEASSCVPPRAKRQRPAPLVVPPTDIAMMCFKC